MLRRLLVLAGGVVAAGVIAGSAAAFGAAPTAGPVADARGDTAALARARAAAARPLAANGRLPAAARRLLRGDRLASPRRRSWRRPPSPCAQYYISVPPLAADKTQLRADQAWRIRALGPAFHALAEINVTGWTSWVATTGKLLVRGRRRGAAAHGSRRLRRRCSATPGR